MSEVYKSMSLSNPHPPFSDVMQKVFATVAGLGLLIIVLATVGVDSISTPLNLGLSLAMITVGVIGFAYRAFRTKPAGIKNHGVWFSSTMSRGVIGWIAGIVITGFYVVLYWYEGLLGLGALMAPPILV